MKNLYESLYDRPISLYGSYSESAALNGWSVECAVFDVKR